MKKIRLEYAVFFLACSLVALVALAGPKDFWETKPYMEWTEKEVNKLLLDNSPWTHELLLNSPGSVNIGSTKSGGGSSGPPPIYISWYAQPIREAVARRMVLMNPETPKTQIDAVVNHKSDFFEFMLINHNPVSGRGGGGSEALEKFKAETYLQKKNNEKIPLAQYQPPGRNGVPAFLRFPKAVDGQPTITADDKEIRLIMKIGDNTYRFPFKLDKMVVKGNLEL